VVALRRIPGLTDELARLAAGLETLDLRGAALLDGTVATERDRLAGVIRSYLIPRLDNPEQPLLVVVAGPTGSGKSTMINTLAGFDLSPTGPLRPTTDSPVLLTRAAAHEAGMSVGGVECAVVVGSAPILRHMSLVDTPDVDSTSRSHRTVAEALIDHADIVVFVSSALRYADDVPWQVLRRAIARGAGVVPVLNRIRPGGAAAFVDFRDRLRAEGIEAEPVRVPEHHIGPGAHQVPSLAVRELKRQLYAVAQDRERFHRETVNRVMNATTSQVRELIGRLESEADTAVSSMRDRLASTETLPTRARPWASPAFGPSSGRPGSWWWAMRSEPTPAAQARWVDEVASALTAEVESTWRRSLAGNAPIVASLPAPSAAIARDVHSMTRTAVDDWMAGLAAEAVAHRRPRLAAMASVSAALTPMPGELALATLGPGHEDLVTACRRDLEQRLAVVLSHQAERVVELWEAQFGDPGPGDLEGRLTAVVAAYQFADA
jgi:energy-coupling factor transporter ATP-binding protein EcfA2